MPNTDGRWSAATGFTDGQLFVGADKMIDVAGLATGPTYPALGTLIKTVPAGSASNFVISLSELLQRSGVYADSNYDQEQFGTAAAVPGPSLISNTGGPLQLYKGQPPVTSAKLATVSGSYVPGPAIKGIQLDSVDVIYQVLTVTAALAQIGVTSTKFVGGSAPAATALLALGANSLPTAIAAQPQVTNVPITAPTYIAGLDTQYLINLKLTAGAGGTISVFGIVPKFHYNFA